MEGGQETMMREPRPWWAKRTGNVNLAIVGAVLLLVLWATFFR
jgi:hypothetical protein